MISVLEPMKTFSAEDGLTEEAVITKLRTCRYHYLYLHTSLRHNSSGVILVFYVKMYTLSLKEVYLRMHNLFNIFFL